MTGPLPQPPTVREAFKRLLEAMWCADVNSEGRDLFERRGARVTAGWQWLDWQFGGGVHLDQHAQEGPTVGAWIAFGPASLGAVIIRRKR